MAETRLATRTGAMLFAGAGVLTLANSIALRNVDGVDVSRLRILAVLSLASAGAVFVFPARRRFGVTLAFAVAAYALVLLIAAGEWAGYATTHEAATAFPVFFVLILAWLGLTQPRGLAALFAPVIVLGCAFLTVHVANSTVSFSGLLLAIGASVVVAETIAWAMARSRRHAGDLRALVGASSDLRDVLSLAEGARLAVEATRVVLHADRVELFMVSSGLVDVDEAASFAESVTMAAAAGDFRTSPVGVAVPLVGPSGTIAVVFAHGVRSNPVANQLVQLLSSEFGGRLEQLRVLESLGEETLRDALTGVGSRRHADALIDGLQLGDSLLLIDVDHFKDVNDTRGHLGGDRLLEALGAHLRAGLRDVDSVARYGGDEFLVRLRARDGVAVEVARRLLDQWTDSGDAPTFSVGIARHEGGAEPRATFAEADAALYRSKREGRARIAVASVS